jgi:hypothetical protein
MPDEGTPTETPKRLAPKRDTLRELFLKTGNLCSFPGCDAVLMDEDGTFAAQICHVEAAEPQGERFNPSATNEERRAFSNLILFCYRHHQITNDVSQYDVATLKAMKAAHERRFSRPDRPMLEKLAKARWHTLVSAGAAAALSIGGLAQQVRSAFDALVHPARKADAEPKPLRTELLNVLRYGPRGTVHCYSRDPLHLTFGEVLLDLFQKSGWYIDWLQAPLYVGGDIQLSYDRSMMMLFTVRDPHQLPNAEATTREFFDLCGFKSAEDSDITIGIEGGRTLTFCIPVGIKQSR